jgi:cytochrome P450
MTHERVPPPDWDPRSGPVLDNQIAAFDRLRHTCPVARGAHGYLSLFRHDDVLRVLHDPATFSSAVSRYPSVPNGMDPPEHGAFRAIIDPYFSPSAMATFEPTCRQIAARLVARLPADGAVDLVAGFAELFALQVQCAFMGWPADLHQPLHRWTRKNHAAIRARDEAAMGAVAFEFDGTIRKLLEQRRQAGAAAPDDVTTRLMRDRVHGRPLATEEIVSIIRNWTVGELATIAASVSIVAYYLAERAELQQQLREQPELLPAAVDEILRLHGPLVVNRRITTKPVILRGRKLAAGERLAIIWPSANRDEAVFGNPDKLRLDRDPALNLLYGAGIHVCPGAPLARLELRVVMEALLQQTSQWSSVPGHTPVHASYPASGYAAALVRICKPGIG